MHTKAGLIWLGIYRAENPGEWYGTSGFKWDKLWEGIESARDMADAVELTCVFSMKIKILI